jgi:hypothetical protein
MLLPLALIGFVGKAILYKNDILHDFFLNTLFILLQLVCLTLYFSIKKKKLFNIVDTYMGLGDILFFIVVCAVFSPVNFIAFYFISMILTLTGVLLYNFFSSRPATDIPLAGSMAAVLLLIVVTTFIFPGINFYNDGLILNVIQLR